MSWLSRHAATIQAAASVATVLVAAGALLGVRVQLDEADRLQRAQSAREAYRAHLALAATQPGFADPQDACALLDSDQGGAYVAFVDHLIYSAEQMLPISQGWDQTFLAQLQAHGAYLCTSYGPVGETEETERLLNRFRTETCAQVPSCD